ncbi:BRCT domain-containing protein [Listeria booriae]|uniref:BRCT domain-containing protein n=1 Tax=Listeria booriae TaxID=1552123 RepID=UPI002892E085|nr:BRCT domain-containing protein [Listeria booriae]
MCFTGKSRFIRSDMQEIAIINGAKISNNIQSSTTMLVVGEDAGSKLDKAQEKEIIIISDDEFMEMVGDNIVS